MKKYRIIYNKENGLFEFQEKKFYFSKWRTVMWSANFYKLKEYIKHSRYRKGIIQVISTYMFR